MTFSTQIKYTVKPGKRPPKTLTKKLEGWQGKTIAALSQQPGSVKRPIRWTPAADQSKPPNTRWGYYSKQKAAFFATKGFGRGIPTQRTGKVAEWIVFVDYGGLEEQRNFLFQLSLYLATVNPFKPGKKPIHAKDFTLVSIENPASYMRYVTGFDQQGFHKDTGWVYTPSIVLNAVEEMDTIIRDTGIL